MGRLVWARTRKQIWSPNHARKNPKVKLGLRNWAMLPSYFDCIFVHLRQKARLRSELSPKFFVNFWPEPQPDSKSPARLTTLSPPRQFCVKKYFWKKISCRGNAHWTNYWISIQGPGPPGRTSTPTTAYFMKKEKSSRKIFKWIIIYC